MTATIPLIVTNHAVERARERFAGLRCLTHAELCGLLRRVAQQGRDAGESYVVGQRYIAADLPDDGMVVCFVKPDRFQAGNWVIASVMTMREVLGAGAVRKVA